MSSSSAKVSLVTGAGQGIGKAIALQLAKDGFRVVLNDLDSNRPKLLELLEELNSINGYTNLVYTADVSVEQEVKDMVEHSVKELGSLDVMVANAGIVKCARLVDTTVEDWDQVLTINARGTFLCYKHAGKQMIAQGRGGRIIGASSIVGKMGGLHLAAYTGSKFAIRGITQTAAKEFGQYGITVNAYAPGAIETSMLEFLNEENGRITGTTSSQTERMLGWAKTTAIGRTGTPEEVAGVVSFLASDKASYVTGQTISCNGGWHYD